MTDAFPKRLKAFVLFGAPGSGKGTQGRVLGEIPGFFHCACGDVFRALDTNSELGKKFVEVSSTGQLIPDEMTVELWVAQVKKWIDSGVYSPDSDIILLDGIPRSLNQAKILDQYVDVIQVIHLSCPDREELVRRMKRRAVKENRLDDANEETINKRIATYEAETKPMLEFYSEDAIANIDALQTPVKTLSDILNKITKLDL
ncbi:adenylate kinase family protein [Persicirhabdus sediminis]|uniref:Adenylate kinase n=1 Tax=Persicirhabdus sediminis TaxID=454144 RepID=A0A8J7MCZ3_9BACT|nr:nucleoside monophosphate kinase [Persicirhabdus sediminis]MBK1790866.1 nucleoside monophosphate kinase [Persicirhabdus sediminis]